MGRDGDGDCTKGSPPQPRPAGGPDVGGSGLLDLLCHVDCGDDHDHHGGDDHIDDDGAATTTSTTSTSTIAATTTTTALPDDDVPPEIDLTADTFADFDHWWVEANRFYEWLGTHPTDDRDVLSILYHPAGPEIAQEIELNAAYLRDGVRWPNASLGDAIAVGCCPDPQHYMDGGRIPLLVVTTHPETTLVTDAEGNLIEELGGWARFTWKVEVVETDPGVWLVWDLGEALE